MYGLGTLLYSPLESGDYIFGHDGGNSPAVNTTVRINPETRDSIIAFSTGSYNLSSQIGDDWVNWQINRYK